MPMDVKILPKAMPSCPGPAGLYRLRPAVDGDAPYAVTAAVGGGIRSCEKRIGAGPAVLEWSVRLG
ncbi:hypothetical protein [Azospirillum endophyticum]